MIAHPIHLAEIQWCMQNYAHDKWQFNRERSPRIHNLIVTPASAQWRCELVLQVGSEHLRGSSMETYVWFRWNFSANPWPAFTHIIKPLGTLMPNPRPSFKTLLKREDNEKTFLRSWLGTSGLAISNWRLKPYCRWKEVEFGSVDWFLLT